MALIKIDGKAKFTGKTIFNPGYNFADTDAAAYVTAVEAADGASLEVSVKQAIDSFVVGCKADGIWSALKASCILAGAQTLNGALVPLVGTAPTNFNFVSADYDRKTGLKGNTTTKYLNSNRNNNADPKDSKHLAIYISQVSGGNICPIGAGTAEAGTSQLIQTSSGSYYRINYTNSVVTVAENFPSGFVGGSRASASNIDYRRSGTTTNYAQTSTTPLNSNLNIFRRSGGTLYSPQRLSFYSIGESLDLALLDTRVSALMTAINAAI